MSRMRHGADITLDPNRKGPRLELVRNDGGLSDA
jgi:hypothetical protein